MDRRIKKTQELIYNVFIELLKESGFNKISVGNIAEKANINRGTFYFHFSDKYDLLEKCIEYYINELISHCKNNTEIQLDSNAMTQIFEYLKINFDIYRTLLSNEGESIFHKKLYNAFEEQIKRAIIKMPVEIINNAEIATPFIANGFIGVIEWWMNKGMPYTPEVMTKKLNIILYPYTQFFKVN